VQWLARPMRAEPMARDCFKIAAVSGLLIFSAEVGFCQSNWTGQVQCQLNMQNSDYVHQETQTWVITGPPVQQGAMQVYPAMWSTSGQGSMQRAQGAQMIAGQWATSVQGMNAPLNIFVRASDRRLLIGQSHAQVVAPSGVIGVKQSGGTRSNLSSAAYEWRFPSIEAGPDDTVVSGSSAAAISGGLMPLQSPAVTGSAACSWQFSLGGVATPSTPSPTPGPVIGFPVSGGTISPPASPQSAPSVATNVNPGPSTNATTSPAANSGPANNSSGSGAGAALSQASSPGDQSSEPPPVVPSHTTVGKISTFVDQDTEEYEKAPGFVAQIMFQVDQVLDDLTLQQFTAAEWKELEQQTGGTLVRSEHVMRLPPFPAAGYWLSLGEQRYMVSSKGIVNTPTKPSNTTNLPLYVQVGDDLPYAVLPSVAFVASGESLRPTVFRLLQKLPPTMNRTSDTALFDEHRLRPGFWPATLQTSEYNAAAHQSCMVDVAQKYSNNPLHQLIPDRCRKRAPCAPGNESPCCLDYDGPSGDGKPIQRGNGTDCLAIGAKFFEWSTCFVWTVAGACSNEAALPWNNLEPENPAPDCYHNHKYRNCQNLNPNDFKLNPPSRLIKFGESIDLLLRNNTVGNSTCLAIDSKGPAAKLDLNSPGRFVPGGNCNGYRADHFSDLEQKHYEQMKFRFITPKAVSPRPCKATYKVFASSGGKVSKATIVATNPRCGGWSGTINFQQESEWDLAVDVGGNFERKAHMSEDKDVTLTIKNNTGISESEAKTTYRGIDYQAALRGGALTRIVQATHNADASAKGGSDVTLEVQIDQKTGEYNVQAGYRAALGNDHEIATDHGKLLFNSNTPYSADPIVNSNFPGIIGKTSNPKHIQGTWTEKLKPPSGYPYAGHGAVAASWNLTFTPGPQ
jgi:hypothetical protein